MNKRERSVVERAVQFLMIMRSTDPVTYNAIAHSDYLEREVLAPLKKLAKWTERDDAETGKMRDRLSDLAGGSTIHERSVNLRNIFKVSGGVIAALSVFGIFWSRHRKKKTGQVPETDGTEL